MAVPVTFEARDALAYLTSIIDSGLAAAGDAIIGNTLRLVNPWLVPLTTIALALYAVAIALGKAQAPAQGFAALCLKMLLVIVVLQQATYFQWVRDIFLTAAPGDLSNLGSASGTAVPGAHAFDLVLNKAIILGLAYWNSFSAYNPLKLLAIPYWIIAGAAVLFGYGVWLIAHFMCVVYVSIGALFVWMVLFAPLRPIFSAWIGSLFACLVLQALAIIVSAVVIQAESSMVIAITGNLLADGTQMIGAMIAACVIFALAAWFALKLPAAAASLCGGIHFAPSALGAATWGAVQAGGSGAMRAIGRGAAAAPGKAREALRAPMFQSPPGPSLSRAMSAP